MAIEDETNYGIWQEEEKHPPGSVGARFSYLMRELEKRFPRGSRNLLSHPPEIDYLKSIDDLIAEKNSMSKHFRKPNNKSFGGLSVDDQVSISMPVDGENIGTIIAIDGFEFFVRLNKSGIEVHRYYNEIKKVD